MDRAPAAAEGGAWPEHVGQGKAADLRDVAARRHGRNPDVGGRQAGDDHVKQVTIGPLIERTIAKGSVVYTDEYDTYSRLNDWGDDHATVCHVAGEFARDDGDGLCEVHVNTLDGFWLFLWSWLRPHRGISQEKLPLYLGFFEFIHNVRVRVKALLGELIALLVSSPPIPT